MGGSGCGVPKLRNCNQNNTVQLKIVDVLFYKISEFHYIDFTGENERKKSPRRGNRMDDYSMMILCQIC